MNIAIREWQPEDLDRLVEIANNKKIGDTLRNTFPHPYLKENGEFLLDLSQNSDKLKELILAITVEDVVVGNIGLFIKDDVNCKCAEVGYWIGEDDWGKGIATQAVRLICEKGFAEYDIVRIYAEFFDCNIASKKVLEKNGFKYEGRLRKSIYKNGEYHDSFLYAMIKE